MQVNVKTVESKTKMYDKSKKQKQGEPMKKINFAVFVITCTLLINQMPALANVDQLSNMSTEWIRTGNRNAATDSADIVLYNPAGIMKMSDGIHINFGNQTLIRRPVHKFNLGITGVEDTSRSYKQDSNDILLPNLYCAYKKNNFGFFGGIYVPGGGATVDFPDGSINTKFIGAMTIMQSGGMVTSFTDDYLEASSIYLAMEAGAAYKINEMISTAFALRYIDATNKVKAGATLSSGPIEIGDYKLNYSTDADGVGFILGFNIVPTEKLNIGLRYESEVKLDFKTDLNRNDFDAAFGLADYNEKNRRDFPAMFGIGSEYKINDKLTAEADFNWYFQKQADWGKSSTGKNLSDLAGDCWSMGGTMAYQLNDKLLLSAGTIYTKFEWNDIDDYYETIGAFEALYTDNWHLGAGFAYNIKDNIKLNFALGRTIWDDANIEYVQAANNGIPSVQVDTENATTIIAFGIDISI